MILSDVKRMRRLVFLFVLLASSFLSAFAAQNWNSLIGKTMVLYRFGQWNNGWVAGKSVFTNPAKEKPVEQFVLTDASHLEWKYSGQGNLQRACSLTDSVLTFKEPLFGNNHLRIILSNDEVIFTKGDDHLVRAFFVQPEIPSVEMLPATCLGKENKFCNGELDDILSQVRDITYTSETPMGHHFLGCRKATAEDREWLESTQDQFDLSFDYEIKSFDVKLFPNGKPVFSDVNQRRLPDCNAESVLASMACLYPDFIRSIIHEESSESFRVDMFDPDGKPIVVRVSNRFAVQKDGSPIFSVGKDGHPHWTAIMQKAVMKWIHVYQHISSIEGCNAETITPLFTGDGRSFCIQPGRLTNEQLARMITTCLRYGMMVNGGFLKSNIPLGAHETWANHGHSFLPPQHKEALYAIRNPWGKGSDNHVMNVTKADSLVQSMIDIRVISPGAAAKFYRKSAYTSLRNTTNDAGVNETYWRNASTGDWEFGFLDNKVIYDSKVWDICEQQDRKGVCTITAKCGKEQIAIKAGKEKAGKRVFTVGKREIECSSFGSMYLPDYPQKDTVSVMADNGYAEGDSVTIVGMWRGIPEERRDAGISFFYRTVFYDDVNLGDSKSFRAKVDTAGCFSLRIPIENTTRLYYGNRFFTIEPNETYFLFWDLTDGRTYVMGQNARLQNEEISHDFEYKTPDIYSWEKYGSPMAFLVSCDSTDKALEKRMEQYVKEHPTLSERYIMTTRNAWRNRIALQLMQARFKTNRFVLPPDYMEFVRTNYWNTLAQPYTLCAGDFNVFLRDYTDSKSDELEDEWCPAFALLRAEKKGKIKLTESDRQSIQEYIKVQKSLNDSIQDATDEQKQVLLSQFMSSEISKTYDEIAACYNVQEYASQPIEQAIQEQMCEIMEEEGWNQTQKDLYWAKNLRYIIDWKRKPLDREQLDFVDSNIHLPVAKKAVFQLNDKYETIQKKSFTANSLKSSGDLEGLSEGEQILRKILEPYKDKFVLLDVWGTWCGPCKLALAQSQDEYEQLKKYPLVYLYLANNSSDESWKNVIKEYNVTGDNVVHYNLPASQQAAVEKYLDVHSYPCYRLFDQQNNLLDVNADPRNLQTFEELLVRILSK